MQTPTPGNQHDNKESNQGRVTVFPKLGPSRHKKTNKILPLPLEAVLRTLHDFVLYFWFRHPKNCACPYLFARNPLPLHFAFHPLFPCLGNPVSPTPCLTTCVFFCTPLSFACMDLKEKINHIDLVGKEVARHR